MKIEDILIERFLSSNTYKLINFEKDKDFSGVKGGAEALLYASLFSDKRKPILIIKESNEDAYLLSQSISFYKVPVFDFPDYDIVPFTEMSAIGDVLYKRINILNKIINNESIIVVASLSSVLRKIPNKEYIQKSFLSIKKGEKIDIDSLKTYLVDLGYVYNREALDLGVFATRGGIIDIFSPNYSNPLRIELFDDEIEGIRLFNSESGKSFQVLDNALIIPVRECVYDDEDVSNVIKKYEIDEGLREKLQNSKYFAGSENLLPIFYEKLSSLFEYFSDGYIFLDNKNNIKNLYDEYSKSIEYAFNSDDNRFKVIGSEYNLYLDKKTFENSIKDSINILPFQNDQSIHFNFQEGKSFKAKLTEFIEYLKHFLGYEYFIVLTTSQKEQAERFYKLLEDIGSEIVIDYDNDKEINDSKNKLIITVSNSNVGFVSDEIKTLFIADYEVFGRKRKKIKHIPKDNRNLIETFVDLNVGDYAVHVNYGVGRYLGLTRKESNEKEKDYLTLEYAKGDKLYIPVEQMNFVQKYISTGGGVPILTQLGGKAWDKLKSKAKADAQIMARDMVRLYAIRSKLRGTVYEPDTQWQDDFESSFKYEETIDQLRAISDIKSDMESGKMMDRLICGDVGFGKTEVAFRAIFKAVMAGKQVAVLCPTTILSKQHYENAKERFKDFPVKVELLNRFRTPSEITRIKERLKSGDTDLIIGTHKLLGKDITFKNLGLIVIDEEQRFGVAHKDSLKKLRLETDVITLSATPIPRTLNMALSGVRDISIIETPPLNRVPVKTFVMEYNEETLINAINKELGRGGQVFILFNRVETIDAFAVMIKGLCKYARVGVGHGQLGGIQLENIMDNFIEHKFDILVSTTIIENGIDIPNANTIIIMDAHKLGLSELYQLRGRVGRSDREAYAYMFFPDDLSLSEVAYKRLQAISEHTDLGAGFKIAMSDLEIRGAGNILGKEQSGMIYQVGYELYTQMLEEAASEYKGEIKSRTFDTAIDFKNSLFIPDSFIEDSKEKISIYKLIMRLQNEKDIEDTKLYIKDKYGKMPKEVLDIFEIASLKSVLRDIRVLSVVEGNYNIYIKLDEYSNIDTKKVLDIVNTKNSGVYLDKTNFSQMIIPVLDESLEWKVVKIKDVMSRIKSDNTSTEESKTSMSEINIQDIKEKSGKKMYKIKRKGL